MRQLPVDEVNEGAYAAYAEEAKHNGGQIETCQEEHTCCEREGADDRAACGSNIDDVLASQPQEAATASAQTWEDVLGVRRDWKSWVESRLEQPIGNAWAPGTFKKPKKARDGSGSRDSAEEVLHVEGEQASIEASV